jgi:hypothetical protein
MLIDYDRFDAACRRLAQRELQRRVDRHHLAIHSRAEFDVVLRRVMLPRAWVKMARRLWKRGHIIIDFKTREVARQENFENFANLGIKRGDIKL